MKGNSKKGLQIAIWLVLVLCIGCAGYGCFYFYQQWQLEKQKAALEDVKVTLEEVQSQEFTGSMEGDAPKLPGDVTTGDRTSPIDFEKLASYNEELYAWVYIPDTNIDYPVAQHEGEDPYHYLHYDMYNEPAFAGCIFTENLNSKDFSDPNTVLYGHNMKNGSMFQNLHLFEDSEFFEENQMVYVYTPDHVYSYQIFAAYKYDDRHILRSFDFSDKEVFADYIEDCLNPKAMGANIREDVEVTADDKILTLSTCVGGDTDARYLVQAVLIKDEWTR